LPGASLPHPPLPLKQSTGARAKEIVFLLLQAHFSIRKDCSGGCGIIELCQTGKMLKVQSALSVGRRFSSYLRGCASNARGRSSG